MDLVQFSFLQLVWQIFNIIIVLAILSLIYFKLKFFFKKRKEE